MTSRFFRSSFVAVLVWLALSIHGLADSARIAVIGDPSLGDLIDLTTTELSKNGDLTVLERADLNKLGQEQALQAVVSSNNFTPIQLIPADGLVILRAVKQDGKTGVYARLVAVQPGIVLRETALPDSDDPTVRAQAIATEFAPYWPKLSAIQKGKITALSLLGLRFEVDSPDTREMERRINVLLASRLSTEPDTVVLERWRLNDAVFEKSVNAQQPAPFWTGSSLIDGSMTFSDNQVSVKLRVRPPQGAEISISDQDKVDQLPALIGRLADKIQTHPMAQQAWQPVAEADHFAALGKWCLDNRLYDEGAEAIESALALGNTSQTTRMLQIRAYALLAYPDELEDTDSVYGVGKGLDDEAALPGRLQSGALAVDLTCDYMKVNHDYTGPAGTLEDPAVLSPAVLHNVLRTLRLAYDNGYHLNHADDVTALRKGVQNLIAQIEALPTAKPAAEKDFFLQYKIDYAAFWHDSPEATLAYYRELLNKPTDGVVIRRDMFLYGYPILHRPYLDADQDLAGAAVWDLGTPWIIAWDDKSPSQIKTTWLNFLKDLASSPDPVLQADELKFEYSCLQTDPARDAAEARFVDLITRSGNIISGPRGNDFSAGFLTPVQCAVQQENVDSRNQLRAFMEAELRSQTPLPAEWLRYFDMIFYYRDHSDQAQGFAKLLDDYCKWYQTQTPQDPAVVAELASLRKTFLNQAAETALKSQLGGFLQVHSHWPTAAGITEFDSAQVDSFTLMTAENKIWFLTMAASEQAPQVMCIDPASLQTVETYQVPDEYNHRSEGVLPIASLDVSPQWLAVTMNGCALVCSRGTNQWRKLDVPPANYKARWINRELYLLYDHNPGYRATTTGVSGAATAISGLIHVSLPDGKIDNIVSSRRVPPQGALDGQPLGYALDLWSSPGLTIAFDADSPRLQVYTTPLGRNDWKPVTSDSIGCDIKMDPQGALIGKGFDDHGFAQLVLMHDLQSILFLSNPARIPANPADHPVWDCPEDIQAAAAGEISQNSPTLRGEDLCLYRNILNGTGDGYHASLYYFTHGQKTGLEIPLAFSLEGMSDPRLIRIQSAIFDYRSVQATDYGLVIGQVMHGFWVIPWKDIDAYRAHGATGAGAISAVPTAPVISPDPVEAAAPPVDPVEVTPFVPTRPLIHLTPYVTPPPVTPTSSIPAVAPVAPVPAARDPQSDRD